MDRATLFAPIAEIAAAYRQGSLSPVEVTRACLARIEALDPTLNAFVTVLREPALAAAEAATQRLKSGEGGGALLGIPVAVKDIIDMAGLPTSFASKAEPGYVATHDAASVRRLRAAGAVLIGKTNLLEFAYGAVHPDFGQTNNPWDPGRTSGGSSGGSAAAVAAGCCYGALGTDTGGSIRIPAAYCGLVGLKPSFGLADIAGVYPLSRSLDHLGPLTRRAGDGAALLSVLAERPFGAQPADLAGRRLGLLTQHIEHPAITAEVRAAFDRACADLAAAGAVLEEVALAELERASWALRAVMMPEASLVHAERLRRRPEGYAETTRQQLEQGFTFTATDYLAAERFRQALRQEALTVLGRVDAILTPTAPFVAPAEDPPITGAFETSEEMLTIEWQNLTGLPALSLPCGLSAEGLPIGLQITTGPAGDGSALALAAAFERLYSVEQARLDALSRWSAD